MRKHAARFFLGRGALAVVAFVGAVLLGCTTTPYTNRSQLILLSEAEEVQLGLAAYKEVLAGEEIVRDPEINGIVVRVGERIARAAEKPAYDWQFTVIDDPKQVNAFALPGGKVAVYTGLFPVARDEAGLAVVIGHEVAHALARHGAERMSQGVIAQIVGTGVAVAVGGQSVATRNAVMQAYGLGAQVGVLLPFSRSQEEEADRIGMILMAKAGYDPAAALGLWQRMEQQREGGGPPDFLSTHPSPASRQERIREWLPEARRYYDPDPNRAIAPLPAP